MEDYELRFLMLQLLFNLKKTSKIAAGLSSSDLKKVLNIPAASFANSARIFIQKAIPSVELVELVHDGKLYNTGPDGENYLWLDMNYASLTCNAADPISHLPVLIEVFYSSILAWNVHEESLFGQSFFVSLKLNSGQTQKIGCKSIIKLNMVKGVLLDKIPQIQKRKVSVVENPSQNLNEKTITDSQISSPPPLSCSANLDEHSANNVNHLLTPPMTTLALKKTKDLGDELKEAESTLAMVIESRLSKLNKEGRQFIEGARRSSEEVLRRSSFGVPKIRSKCWVCLLKYRTFSSLPLLKTRRIKYASFDQIPKWELDRKEAISWAL